MPHSSDALLERALCLVMDSWGLSRDRAMQWLNDDTQDWTQIDRSNHATMEGAFIQVTRTTKINLPPPCR